MAGYNLDEKGGLFGIGAVKSPAKIMKKGDTIELRHFSVLSPIKASVTDLSEATIKASIAEKDPEIVFTANDPVVVYVRISTDNYVVNGEISSVDKPEPAEITIKPCKIEKVKDSIKSQRFFSSFPAAVKTAGAQEAIDAVIKVFSLSAVKINCKADIALEAIVDVTSKIDKTTRIAFKGKVVRRNKLNDCFEYGVEIKELPETSSKILHQLMSRYEFG